MEYSKELLNYFRICHVAFNLVPVGLRQIFKQEWDFLYKTTPLGEWIDTPQNGRDFCNNESRRSCTKNARYLATIHDGDTSEWDCSCLFFAILYSDSIGTTLSPAISAAIDDIRQVRNDIAHINEGKLTDVEFQTYAARLSNDFLALGLPINEIEDVKNQTSFPTEEVENLKKEVRDLKNELDKTKRDLQNAQAELQSSKDENKALTQEINSKLETFCFLASKPPHEVMRRTSDMERLAKKMQELLGGADRVVSTIYLSGNPGCGKSQLARQLGLEFFSQRSHNTDEMTFLATVNAENIETLTDSYITLGKHLGITEYSLTRLETSKREKPEETIECLHGLMLPQVRKYSTWLIVADNVVDLKSVRSFLPQTGSEEWGHGQVLITTQDSSVIPPEGAPHTYHESFSKGMQKEDAVVLLEKVSQVYDREQAKIVAKVLDYQPLALAAAAYYVQTVVQNGSPDYNWSKYLEGLTGGQREATENVLVSESSAYSRTTTKAVEMALQRAVETDEVLRHTFSFFALCACEVVPLDTVVKFVKARVTGQPEELIKGKILRSCMILVSALEKEEKRPYLGLHNIVHKVVKLGAICKQKPSEKYHNMAEAVKVYKSTLEAEDRNYALLKKLTLHCRSLLEHMTSLSSSPKTLFVNTLTPFITVNEVLQWLLSFGRACKSLSDFFFAKHVVDLACSLLDNISDTDEEALMKLRTSIYTLSGCIYDSIGKYSEAEDFHEKSLMISTRIYGEEDVHVADSCVNLGNVHFHTGKKRLVKDLYEKSIAIYKKTFGEDSLDVADSYVCLGNVYCSIGEFRQAKEIYEKALEIQERICVGEDTRVTSSYVNLGIVYYRIGDYKQAKEFLERALTIDKNICGENSAEVARDYVNLGNVYSSSRESKKAKELYEKALVIYQNTLGEWNNVVATTYANLGHEYWRTGEYTKAKQIFTKVREIRKEIFSEDNALVTETNNRVCELNDLDTERRQSMQNIRQSEVTEDLENRVIEEVQATEKATDKCCNCVLV